MPLTSIIDIDTDTTKDTHPTDDPDGIKDNDANLTVAIDARLVVSDGLSWSNDGNTEQTPNPNAAPYTFTVLASAPEGSIIGSVFVDGGENDTDNNTDGNTDQGEFLRGIILNEDGSVQSKFSVVGARDTSTDESHMGLQVKYNGNGGADLTPGIYKYRLSVNGDSGIANRTLSGNGPAAAPLVNMTVVVNPCQCGSPS